MQALTLQAPFQLSLTEAAHPGAPGPGEALVRVYRAGVCGTDYHAVRGAQPFFSFPRVLGHELGVEVLEVGPAVENVRPGDRCAVEPYLNCGHCMACRRGRSNCCAGLQVLGVHTDGGMVPMLRLPAHKLHPSRVLNYEQLALIEPFAIGAHAVARVFGARTELQTGFAENVLVVGAGPIGLATAQAAVARGHNVALADVNGARLDFAAHHLALAGTLNLSGLDGQEVPPAVAALWNGEMPTAVFDATGNATSMARAFELPAVSGALCFVGLVSAEIGFNDPQFHRRELTAYASRNALREEFADLIQAVEQGKLATDFWVTHRASLEEAPARILEWMAPEAGVVKAMVQV